MSDIFISYAREDLERTRQLANALGSLGWNVFIDRRIPAGKTWAEYIGKELNGAKCVIVIWSNASLGSRFVKLEANNALANGKLIPVLIEDVSPPFEFGDLHAADLSIWDGDKNSEEFSYLATDIESLIGSRPKIEAVSDKSKVEEEKRLKEAAEARRKVEEETRLPDPIQEFTGHTSEIFSVAFSPDGRQILTGSWDDTARLWYVPPLEYFLKSGNVQELTNEQKE